MVRSLVIRLKKIPSAVKLNEHMTTTSTSAELESENQVLLWVRWVIFLAFTFILSYNLDNMAAPVASVVVLYIRFKPCTVMVFSDLSGKDVSITL